MNKTNNDEDNFLENDDVNALLNEIDRELSPEEIEKKRQERARELENKGFLPENDELRETMTSPQESVELNPRRFIIEECIPACQELWSKNIYTFMVSDHLNEGVCWIEVVFNSLSDENKDIYMQIMGDDVVKFSYHKGCVNFGVKCVGVKGQQKLLELAKLFKMQDVPKNQAWISEEEFLMNYCNCYDEYDNPNYRQMQSPFELDLEPDELIKYMEKYYEWEASEASQERLRKYAPNKVNKPISEYAKEHGMIYEDGRIYLSPFHYQKHINYMQYMENAREQGIPHK